MKTISNQEKNFYTRGCELIDKGESFQIVIKGPGTNRWRKKITLGVDWPTAPNSVIGDPWQLIKLAISHPSLVFVCGLLMHAEDCGMLSTWQEDESTIVVTLIKEGG